MTTKIDNKVLRKECEQLLKQDLLKQGVPYQQALKQIDGRFDNYSRPDLDRWLGVRAYINLKEIQN